ncbi:two-component system regulatory protein YycI [Proteinivorax hydrogeniformans]|uniref:Two-component system regulatory protein YycI n=1 Tax=Proteinivorax hydrogeniformans TaxID=1826727 RepID=A0AAU8HT01_9FIRM
MDWSKAKSIFIVVFALLNIFLAVQIWMQSPGAGFSTTPEEVDKVRNFLNNSGIEVQTDIPDRVEYKNFLDVRGEPISQNVIKNQFFDEDEEIDIENYSDEYVDFSGETGRVIKKSDGRIVYESHRFRPPGNNLLTEKDALKVFEDFHKQGLSIPDDARLTNIEEFQNNRFRIEYHQVYRRQRVDTSYITMVVGASGVESYEKYWVNPLGYSGGEYLVIPSTGALMRLVDYVAKGDEVVVTDISLSYYSEPISAGQWQVAPVWAITIQDVGNLYLNAYTGELEGYREY